MTVGPVVGRALLRWVVFIVLLSGAGLLALRPGTPGYVLSVLMLGCGVPSGAALLVWVRVGNRRGGS